MIYTLDSFTLNHLCVPRTRHMQILQDIVQLHLIFVLLVALSNLGTVLKIHEYKLSCALCKIIASLLPTTRPTNIDSIIIQNDFIAAYTVPMVL